MTVQPRIPVGTQVVVHDPASATTGIAARGVTGRVVQHKGQGYAVSSAGRLVDARHDQLTPVSPSEPTTPPPHAGASSALVTERTVYAAAVGFPAERSNDVGAEVDIRAVYQAPTSAFWSLSKPPKHVAGPGPSWFSWEIERFCELALKASPTCLELLWSRLPVWVGEAGHELLDLRGAFLSQLIPQAYSAHVLGQFKKLDEIDRQRGEQRWKHAAHLLGELMEGTALLRTGDVYDAIGERRQQLWAVRSGQVPWDQVESWRLELQRQLEEAASATFLPATPDVERVNAWLSYRRRRDASAEVG